MKEKVSLIISIIMTKALLAGMGLMIVAAPWIVRIYDNNRILILGAPTLYMPILVTMYLAVAVGIPSLIMLDKLLLNIKKNMIFIKPNVMILRYISYFCFAEAVIFFGFGFYRPMAIVIAGAAVFFGVAMRVLKNVFGAAVTIREENDFTI